MKNLAELLEALQSAKIEPATAILICELIDVRAELAVMQDCFYELLKPSHPEKFREQLSAHLQQRRDDAARETLARTASLVAFFGGMNREGQN